MEENVGGCYIIEKGEMNDPSVGDMVEVKVTICLPAKENGSLVVDNLIWDHRLDLFGESLWSGWGSRGTDSESRYKVRTFSDTTYPLAAKAAEEYVVKEIKKLKDKISDRALTLKNAGSLTKKVVKF